MKGQIYNFVFQSAIGNGATNNAETYYCDWAILPAGKSFKVSFNFYSINVALVLTNMMLIYINLGQSKTITVPSEFALTQYKRYFLGQLYLGGTNSRIICSHKDNAPIYVDAKPMFNDITVEIVSANNTGGNTPHPVQVTNYTMVLSFEEL